MKKTFRIILKNGHTINLGVTLETVKGIFNKINSSDKFLITADQENATTAMILISEIAVASLVDGT